MKPLRELSTEQIEELGDDEIIELVADEIQSSRASGGDLEEEHVALAPWLEEPIRAEWKREKAWRAKQAKLAEPKVEARPKQAEPSVPSAGKYRRYENVGSSFFGPATQPTVESSAKDNAEEKIEEPAEKGSVGKFVEEIKASTRALEVVKPFDVLSAEQLQTYLDAMNVRHAVIGNIGGKCRVLEWVPSELDEGAHVLSLQSKADLIARYAHIQVGWTNRGQQLTLGQKWFEHPQRANYRGVTFRPGMPAVINNRDTGSWLNVWRGWGILPEKGKWPLLRKHVEEVLSGGDQKMADYNIRWAAWGFQNPGDLPEAALVLRGKKGGGKGIWLGTLRRVYGPHGLQISHARHLTGNFNAHLWTCAYLFADEAFWAGDKQGEAVLKGLITERPLPVEKKGIDVIMAVNRVKLALSSNAYWVVPASDDERRYAVSDIDPRYAKGSAPEEDRKKYFGAIQRELAEGGAAAMLYDLLKMPLGDWHPREVPVTPALMRQKKESLRGHHQWFEPLLQSATLPTYCGRPDRILSEDLLAYVKAFRGLEYASEESIASFLYDEMGFIPKPWPEGNKFRVGGGGKRGWVFSPLLDLRVLWETRFGGAWNWHDPEIDEWQSEWQR
jgi:Family of unknown function (DUF5906)